MPEIAPKVTVYISSHNYGEYLEQAVESVLRQSFDDWELFLVDDNSSDNTREIMQFYAGAERITLLKGEGRGLIPVANKVLSLARGEYIIRLDADDLFDENILLVLSNYMDRHPDVAMTFPDYYLMDQDGVSYSVFRKESLNGHDNVQDLPPHGACTMIRASVLREIGGYDETLSAQDGFYVWSRIREMYGVHNINLPLFRYRQHGYNLTRNSTRITMARQAVKRSVCDGKHACDDPIVAVIPCRKCYDFVPDLWKEHIGDYSLLDMAVRKCVDSCLFTHIVVTADTEEVLENLAAYDDDRIRFIPREHSSTYRSRPMTDTLQTVASQLSLPDSSIMLLCYPQAPFSTVETLEEAIHTLIMFEADSVFSAIPLDKPLYRRGANGLTCINPNTFSTSDFNTIYQESRNVFALRASNLKKGNMTGNKSLCFSISGEEVLYVASAQDIALARSFLS